MKQTLLELQELLFMLGQDVPEDDKRRKAELCEAIMQVVETDKRAVRRWLGVDVVRALRRFFAQQGEITKPLTLHGTADEFILLDPLRELGMACMEERCWLIRPEARSLVYPLTRAEQQDIEAEERLLGAASSILCVLGMAPLEALNRMARGMAGFDGGPAEQLETLLNACYGFRAMAEFDGVKWACHWGLDDEEALWERLQQPFLAALPYPDCDWKRLEWAGGMPTAERGDALYEELLDTLTSRGCSGEQAVLAVANAVLLYQNDRGDEAIMELIGAAQAKPDAALLQRLTDMMNRLPLWLNKGYSAEALMALHRPRRVAPKVGRNEPCPCGSGRKYKNCCGRFQ